MTARLLISLPCMDIIKRVGDILADSRRCSGLTALLRCWWKSHVVCVMWCMKTLGMLGHAVHQTPQLLHHRLDELLFVAVVLSELREDVVLLPCVLHPVEHIIGRQHSGEVSV